LFQGRNDLARRAIALDIKEFGFDGKQMQGKVMATIVGGMLRFLMP
jgi:hypothetical protein